MIEIARLRKVLTLTRKGNLALRTALALLMNVQDSEKEMALILRMTTEQVAVAIALHTDTLLE